MSEKLQKLAVKMSDLFPKDASSPQVYYDLFKDIYKQQKDYFSYFNPSDIVKLIFYIYSYNKTNNFKLADLMLNKIGFASLFITQGDNYLETCSDCGGNGEVECSICDGTSEVECDECNGTGEVECYECLGSGVDSDNPEEECSECNGSGVRTCGACNGDAQLDCPECYDGKEQCYNCDSTGEVETDKLLFDYYVICTWNTFIKDQCELRAETLEPALSEYDFDRLRDDFIVLAYQERYQRFIDGIQTNEIYCTNYSDEPDLHKTISSDYKIWMDDEDMIRYEG